MRCPELNDCSNKGLCIYNLITKKFSCACDFPWEGTECSDLPLISATPDRGEEIGGDLVEVYLQGLLPGYTVSCCFSGYCVESFEVSVNKTYCVTPPFHSEGTVIFEISVNGTNAPVGNFTYEYVDSLPTIPSDLNKIRLTSGTINKIKFKDLPGFPNLPNESDDVQVELFRWEWDSFRPTLLIKSPKLLPPLQLNFTMGKNSIAYSVPNLSFNWTQAVSVLSIRVGHSALRRYVIIKEKTDSEICQDWSPVQFYSGLNKCPGNYNGFDFLGDCEELQFTLTPKLKDQDCKIAPARYDAEHFSLCFYEKNEKNEPQKLTDAVPSLFPISPLCLFPSYFL